MARTRRVACRFVVVGLVLAACGSSSDDDVTSATTSVSDSSTTSSTSTSTAAVANTATIENQWTGATVDLTALPLGTAYVTTSGPAVGDLYVCDSGRANGAGAQVAGPWIDEEAGTWDRTAKVSVRGEVSWPMARYAETVEGSFRTIASNGLPVGAVTGTFPVAADDPAYAYDRNPNSIAERAVDLQLPISPAVATSPTCLPKGSIGVLRNGVALYAPVDEQNRDAVAYETQDTCDGHPQQSSTYHYHDIPSCILDAATGSSTVVGFAMDGFPIVVERDASGALPTNADLDECHGRTSLIDLDGEIVESYHYSATQEFPYMVGCYAGTPVA